MASSQLKKIKFTLVNTHGQNDGFLLVIGANHQLFVALKDGNTLSLKYRVIWKALRLVRVTVSRPKRPLNSNLPHEREALGIEHEGLLFTGVCNECWSGTEFV